MLTTPHAAAGVALGITLGNPVLVIPAALTSHFLLDCVPHWQETLAPYEPTWKSYVRIPIDVALAIGLTIWAAHMQPSCVPAIWAGAIAANIPDLDMVVVPLPAIKRGLMRRYWDWHCRIQRETSSLWGVAPQLAVIAAAILSVQLI